MRRLRQIRLMLGTDIVETTGTCWAAGLAAMILSFAATIAVAFEGTPADKSSGRRAVAEEAKEADLKIRDIGARFDVLMKARNWDAAEKMAIDAAKKYGDRDGMIQFMLLQSLNAKRRQQGLPVIRVDLLVGNEEAKTARLYRVKDLPLWSQDGHQQNADLLINYLKTIDAPSWQNGDSRALYNPKQFELIVVTREKNHKEIAAVLDKLRSKRKPDHDARPRATLPRK